MTLGMGRHASHPNQKISETFLQFAAPVLLDLGGEEAEHRARETLNVSFTVWNAVVFADVLNEHRHLDEIRRLTAGNSGTAQLIEQLIARKRGLFADDERLIGNWQLTQGEDGLNLHADARDPHSIPRGPS